MNWLSHVWRSLAVLFAEALPNSAPETHAPDPARNAEADEARRTSIHDVTQEQLDLVHWSGHTLF